MIVDVLSRKEFARALQSFLLILLIHSFFSSTFSLARESRVREIEFFGNKKVSKDALLRIMKTQPGTAFNRNTLARDILDLYGLGYFANIQVYSHPCSGSTCLTFRVEEKPAIVEIKFTGLNEVDEETLRELIETKVYNIVDEKKISGDVDRIKKKYAEKGFHLARVKTTLVDKGSGETTLTFAVSEEKEVHIGDVFIVGNSFFSDQEISSKLLTKPLTRGRAISGSSLYHEDYLMNDVAIISFLYKDQGFAKVKVGDPVTEVDGDLYYVRTTFYIEEGKQYRLGKVTFSGDVGEDTVVEEELAKLLKLKEGDLFKHSAFARGVEEIINRFGDLGYAYVDVNPMMEFDDDGAIIAVHFKIDKGEKVFFGHINISGNTKTRDNVIRREMTVKDADLYSGVNLVESKRRISRLGFFEEVRILKERDVEQENLVNLDVQVKEKSTGQLQAALGYSPGGEQKQNFFGQGRYEERNQSGRGWVTRVTGKWTNSREYQLDLGFQEPRINDGDWSLGLGLEYKRLERRYASYVEIPETHATLSVSVGRQISDLLRGRVSLRRKDVRQLDKALVYEDTDSEGSRNSLTLTLSRPDLNNYINPTSGNSVSVSYTLTGAMLGGEFSFTELAIDGAWYIPLSEEVTPSTSYFKLSGVLGKLWSVDGVEIPETDRYRLGGYSNLRGYSLWSIGPKEKRMRSPLSGFYTYNIGGDKKLYFQLEYFIPLIPEAGVKAVFFADAGTVAKEGEGYFMNPLKKDLGFGIRWQTPVAPFRFEWAYPYDDESNSLGDLQFIFSLGY